MTEKSSRSCRTYPHVLNEADRKTSKTLRRRAAPQPRSLRVVPVGWGFGGRACSLGTGFCICPPLILVQVILVAIVVRVAVVVVFIHLVIRLMIMLGDVLLLVYLWCAR